MIPEYNLFLHGGNTKRISMAEAPGKWSQLRVYGDCTGCKATSTTYSQLRREAHKIATYLLRVAGCQAGDRILLCYPPSACFVPAFIGCQIAGLTPVPIYPPGTNGRESNSAGRIAALIKKAEPSVVLSSSPLRRFLEDVLPDSVTALGTIRWVYSDELPDTLVDHQGCVLDAFDISPEMPAFIQFTSGSTGNPKGCVVAHRALLHNIHVNWRMCGAVHPVTEETLYDMPVELYGQFTERYQQFVVATWGHRLRAFSWLPVTHDMGLVGMLCVPLYFGCTVFLMSPVDFVRSPELWLSGMCKFGCSFTAAPDFAYRLVTRKITGSIASKLNFEKVLACINGAEPIRPATVQAFLQKFSPAGFRPWMMCPAYGLAENTVGVTGRGHEGLKPRSPRIIYVNTKKLATGDKVELLHPETQENDEMNVKALVGCGVPHKDVVVKIINPDSLQELPEWQIGEIWVSSPSAATGYFGCPEETEATFRCLPVTPDGAAAGGSSFLRTGDLGFIGSDELFITGRLKDIVIIRGRNYYPQDIEEVVEECLAVCKGGVMAFPVPTRDGAESLGVAAEVKNGPETATKLNDIRLDIIRAVNQNLHLSLGRLWILKAGSLKKTTSGKPRRSEMRRELCSQDICPGVLLSHASDFHEAGCLTFPTADDCGANRHLGAGHAEARRVIQPSPGASDMTEGDTQTRDVARNRKNDLHSVKGDTSGALEGAEGAGTARHALESPIPVPSSASNPPSGLLPQEEGEEELRLIAECLARVTGLEASQFREDTPFFSLGLDSLTAAELAEELQQRTQEPVEPFELFEFADLRSLAAHLQRRRAERGGKNVVANYRVPERTLGMSHKQASCVVVTGVACALPGSCQTPDELWAKLEAGVDCIGPVPENRDIDVFENATHNQEFHATSSPSCKLEGGFLLGVECFDNAFFGISDVEAKAMDPQQRLLLMKSVDALRMAGIQPRGALSAPIATFVGCCSSDWQRMNVGNPIEGLAATSSSASMLANRVAYTLGFTGASVTVDTACSSSLTALHCALRELQHPEASCRIAVVAGVNLLLSSDVTVVFARAGFLSPTHRCRTFDDAADGFVRSEGVVVFVLQSKAANCTAVGPVAGSDDKNVEAEQWRAPHCGANAPSPASDAHGHEHAEAAPSAGLHLCRIVASAVVHGGRTSSVTAPSALSQAVLYRQVLGRGRVAPWDVQYVETHGTGTRLGDPIEAQAVCDVFASDAKKRENGLVLGALKTNVGHLEGASGLAGLLKAVLCLNRHRVPPNLHLKKLNRYIDFRGVPVILPTKAISLAADEAVALVTSLGFGGTYAQVAIKGMRAPVTAPLCARQQLPQWNTKCFSVSREALNNRASASEGRDDGREGPYLWEVAWESVLDLDRLPRKCSAAFGERSPPAKWLVLTLSKKGSMGDRFPDLFLPGVRITFACLDAQCTPQQLDTVLKTEAWAAVVAAYNTEDGLMGDAIDDIARTVPLLRAYGRMASDSAALPWMVFLTRGCFHVGAVGTTWKLPPNNAGIVGFARACRLELESLSGLTVPLYFIDVEPDRPPSETLIALSALLGVIESGHVDEAEFSIRGTTVYAPRLLPLQVGFEENRTAGHSDLNLYREPRDGSSATIPCIPVLHSTRKTCRVRLLAVCLDAVYSEKGQSNLNIEAPFCGCSGILLEADAENEHLTVGGLVCGLAPRPQSGIVEVPGALLQHLPPLFSFEAAAAVPPQLAVLLWALETAPPLATPPAESVSRVLIVGAGCGIGLTAATHLRSLGVEAFAVVTTEEQAQALQDNDFPESAISLCNQPDFSDVLQQVGHFSVDMLVWGTKDFSSCSHMLLLLKQGGSFLDLLASCPQSKLEGRQDVSYVRCSVASAGRPYHVKVFSRSLMRACALLEQTSPAQRQPIMHVFVERPFNLGQHIAPPPAPMTTVEAFSGSGPMPGETAEEPSKNGVTAGEFAAKCQHAGHVVCALQSPIFSTRSPTGTDQEAEALLRTPEATLEPPAAADVRSGAFVVFDFGLSHLGKLLTRWLSDEGAEHVILVHGCEEDGDADPQPAFFQAKSLDNGHGRATVIREINCRANLPGDIEELLGTLKKDGRIPRVRGIFYNVGERLDGLLVNQTTDSVSGALQTAAGAWAVHTALNRFEMEAGLDMFVLFSSISSLFGSISQSVSSAVNASLDALACYRRNQGLAALSIQWAPWTDGSCETSARIVRRWLEKGGISSVRNPLEALGTILENQSDLGPVVACFLADVTIMRKLSQAQTPFSTSAMSESSLRAAAVSSSNIRSSPVKGRHLRMRRLESGGDATKAVELTTILRDLVRKEVSEIVSCHIFSRGSRIPTDQALLTLGLDSLAAVELRHALQQRFHVTLEPSFLEAHATVDTIAAFLVNQVAGCRGATCPSAQLPSACRRPVADDCAIVSVSLRLPDRCDSLNAFWASLQRAADCPNKAGVMGAAEGLDQCLCRPTLHAQGQPADQLGSGRGPFFLTNRDEFDNQFFGMSFLDALATDRSHRLLLETAYEALCGLNTEEQKGTRGTPIAVYASSSPLSRRHSSSRGTQGVSVKHLQKIAITPVASFISYQLNLTGGAVPVAATESASLVALSLALEHLRGQKSCQAALVAAGSMIPDCPVCPRSSSLDVQEALLHQSCADATFNPNPWEIPQSEAIVCVVVQLLSTANHSNNKPMAILKGVSLQQACRGGVLNASRWTKFDELQLRKQALSEALQVGKVDPRTVALLETDGVTGTRPDDVLMIDAINDIFGRLSATAACPPLVMGNIGLRVGRMVEASALASLAKIVLALERRCAPPLHRLHSLHPNVRRAATISGSVIFPCKPIVLPLSRQSPETMPRARGESKEDGSTPLVGIISSFGTDGVAGCVVVESTTQARVAEPCKPFIHGAGRALMSVKATAMSWRPASVQVAPEHTFEPPAVRSDRQVWLFCDDAWGLRKLDRSLYATDIVFTALCEHVERVLESRLPGPLTQLLFPRTASDHQMAEDALAVPYVEALLLLSFQWILARYLWQREGKPVAVMGLGLGEVTAAAVAGLISFADAVELAEALTVVSDRGRGGYRARGAGAQQHGSQREASSVMRCASGEYEALESTRVRTSFGELHTAETQTPTSASRGYHREALLAAGMEASEAKTEETLQPPFSRSRWAVCPSPTLHHAWERPPEDVLEEATPSRPWEPQPIVSAQLRQIAARITLDHAESLYISTVTGGVATDCLVGRAEYWDPLIPKKQRVGRALETAERRVRATKLVCIGCSPQDSVHFLTGLPSFPIASPSSLSLYSFTGGSSAPQLLVACESSSGASSHAALFEHESGRGGAPWWRRLSFCISPFEAATNRCAMETVIAGEGGQACATGLSVSGPDVAFLQETGPATDMRSSAAPEDAPFGGEATEPAATSYRSHALGQEGKMTDTAAQHAKNTCASCVYWRHLEKAVLSFIMSGIQEDEDWPSRSPWLMFSDIAAPPPPPSAGITSRGDIEKTVREPEDTVHIATIHTDEVAPPNHSIKVISSQEGQRRSHELARCCFVKNATSLDSYGLHVTGLSRFRWLPALKLPTAWLRKRSSSVWQCALEESMGGRATWRYIVKTGYQ
ncbi:hypothetical protein BESB_036390 [Besnoitia besnoiti]|uniref:AMP-binding enzyme domain-containing protein n=1 Tax=Besnoitia besnoiti TaxID=94643 RepID=A0A2A9MLH4_BESBE|nr:hypothetical protein BESB_036390 [Besnoitia besnoiti]PFH37181.1 hypothetical protein BESB_036390 [Besnoitia besnoiti]